MLDYINWRSSLTWFGHLFCGAIGWVLGSVVANGIVVGIRAIL